MPFTLHPHFHPFFQGFQGPDPKGSKIIFLGKDANFPIPDPPGDRYDRIQKFLEGGDWRLDASFRRSSCYKDRNDHPERAHHPLLLSCFPGNRDGARYHLRFAQLIDRIIKKLAKNPDIVAHLVDRHCTFVELISLPTFGNIGNRALNLFRVNSLHELHAIQFAPPVPPAALAGAFVQLQSVHRTKTLPEWLLNGQSTVVAPKSVFKVLCDARWQGLNHQIFDYTKCALDEYPIAAIHGDAEVPAGFQHWLITRGFPYFRRGMPAKQIAEHLEALAHRLFQRLVAA